MARFRTPGNAVEVYLEGKRVFRYAAGYSDLEKKTDMTGEEMFNIYSCSKIATVTAGLQLVERGKIVLSDPLSWYLSEFSDMYVRTGQGELKKAKQPITVKDLFTMTAGFDYNIRSEAISKAKIATKGHMDTVETVKCIASEPLSFEPGTRWQYSLCHDVLAALVSVVSGKKFREYVKENIFEPLDMKDSVYHQTTDTGSRMAQQYRFTDDTGEYESPEEAQKNGNADSGRFLNVGQEVPYILGDEYDSGGAGIITTLSDYAELAAALAGFGKFQNGNRILCRNSVEAMRRNHLNQDQLKYYDWKHLQGYGYGLGVRTHMDPCRSGRLSNVGEFGWGGSAGSTVVIDPDIGLGVFYVQHCLNPREQYYQPRLINVLYSCL